MQKIGENITIRRFAAPAGERQARARTCTAAKIGVLVDYEGADEAGKDVAMHIAFAKPAYLTKAEVPAGRRRSASATSATRAPRNRASRPRSSPRWSRAALNKFLGEITLLGQPFIKDDKQTVEKMLAAKKAKVLGYRASSSSARASRKAATSRRSHGEAERQNA